MERIQFRRRVNGPFMNVILQHKKKKDGVRRGKVSAKRKRA